MKGTLVGMKTKAHTTENLKVCYESPLDPEEFWDFLRPPAEEMAKIDAELDNENQENK